MTEIDRSLGDAPWRCGTCKYWHARENPLYGECDRWMSGYHHFGDHFGVHGDEYRFPVNEVVVEDDEGWGAIMGHKFGCVLWEAKP